MVRENTLGYYELLKKDEHHRYKSWEHIYLFFKKNHRNLHNEEVKDQASLHLAFYLASWGMLRGGSFLLQKDYKIHRYFIESIAADPKFWIFYSEEEMEKEIYFALIEELILETMEVYRNAVIEINGKKKTVVITDTLVTKILLGVYGNVPAFDRYFKAAAKEHGISASLGRKSLEQILEFYEKHREEFSRVQESISEEVYYPPMKLIDMYFFNYGLEKDKGSQESVQEDLDKAEIELEPDNQSASTKIRRNQSGMGIQSVRNFILEKLAAEKAAGAKFVDLKSGDIHNAMGLKSRLPTVCQAMISIPNYRIEVIHQTPSGLSSTNVVRYFLN